MKQRVSLAILVAILAALASGPLQALAVEDVYSERTMEIARNLSCPICDGQSVADSQSRLAVEMRNTIESQVQEGWSDEEIYDFFEARFGEEVLAAPRGEGINLALWWIPVAAVIIGAVVVVLYLRDSRRMRPAPASEDDDSDYDAELEQIAQEVLGDRGGKQSNRLATDPGSES